MKSMTNMGTIASAVLLIAVSGCANTYTQQPAGVSNSSSARPGYGLVQAVEVLPQQNTGIAGTGIGVGAIAGAVVGGIVGNQVGAGRGNAIATVAGAAGGAYVGNEIEKRQQQANPTYKITVRMNDGAYQTVVQELNAGLRVGDRVQISNGVVQRY